MSVDRLIRSVERASTVFCVWCDLVSRPCLVAGPTCPTCGAGWQAVENAALALDMALAQASDARRAEDDRLRAEVAW